MTPPRGFDAGTAHKSSTFKADAASGPKNTWEQPEGFSEDTSSEMMSSPCDSPRCPYELLGVQPCATDAWIRSAFRKASLQVHPDRCPNDPTASAKFRRLMHAKDLLLNPLKRRIYDVRHGHQARRAAPNPIWWSDWDTIFGELDATVEEDMGEEEDYSPNTFPPEKPISHLQKLEQADIVIVGATGIMGTLACRRMHCQRGGCTWAIAGRSGRKLSLLEAKFGGGPDFRGSVRLQTPQDVERVVRAARVVVNVTGPSRYAGLGFAEACAGAGRHYVDISTEVDLSKTVKDKFDSRAKVSGSCMVMHAGETATIADFGSWALARHFKEQHKVSTHKIDLFEWCTGFCIGGTEHLAGGFIGADTRGVSPFLLGGARSCGVQDKERTEPVEEKEMNCWSIPSQIAERLTVRATCGMLEESYGRKFSFRNVVPFLDKDSALVHQTRSLVAQQRREQLVREKKVPPPGHGPGERKRHECWTSRVFVGTADEVRRGGPRKAHLIMQYGPAALAERFEGSAIIALETAMTLIDAEDAQQTELLRPGWGTPVHHLAHLGFMDRLVARGLNCKIVEGLPPPELIRNIVSNTMPLQVDEAQG